MSKEKHNDEFDYCQAVEDVFNQNGWHFNVRRDEGNALFSLPMSAKNCPGLNVKFTVNSRGDCKLRCYIAENTPKSVQVNLLSAINTLNARFRYITLSVDSDSDILAAYDFGIFGEDTDSISKQVTTMIVLFSDITDKCIPSIMKVVWSASEDEEKIDEDKE